MTVGRLLWVLITVGAVAGGFYFPFDRSEPEEPGAPLRGAVREPKRQAQAPPAMDRPPLPAARHRPAPAAAPVAQGWTDDYLAGQEDARLLLADILAIKPVDGKFSVDQLRQVNANLGLLRQQGPAAVPAIQEYLESMAHVDLSAAVNPKVARAATLRLGLIDALEQIGGADATQVMVQTLETSADPKEIALLAKGLERRAGSQYRPDLMAAVSETLDIMLESTASAAEDDAGFLFAVLERHGGDHLAGLMEQTYPRWKSYSTMVLATLPNGAGIPALTRLAQANPEAGQENAYALQMLAQASREHPQAAEALVQIAASEGLPGASWRRIAKTLGGEEFRFRSELFAETRESGARLARPQSVITGLAIQAHHRWSEAELEQRMQLIDGLSALAPPEARGAFDKARARLSSWRHARLTGGALGRRLPGNAARQTSHVQRARR